MESQINIMCWSYSKLSKLFHILLMHCLIVALFFKETNSTCPELWWQTQKQTHSEFTVRCISS